MFDVESAKLTCPVARPVSVLFAQVVWSVPLLTPEPATNHHTTLSASVLSALSYLPLVVSAGNVITYLFQLVSLTVYAAETVLFVLYGTN